MSETRNGALTEGPVSRRLLELWLPMIGGVLAVKAIGLSDAYFVGKLGEQPLAAISFTFPVVMTLISLAIGLSAGASSLLSRSIGDGAGIEQQQAIVTGAIAMGFLVALVLAVTGFVAIGPVLALMGASEAILDSATDYMRIWFVGVFFLIVPVAINGMLRATGDGVSPALLMAAIAALNIGLNPVFIFGVGPVPGLGMEGAAVATIAARMVSTVGALVMILKRDLLALSFRRLWHGLGYWREVARVGLPAALSTSLNPVALSIATAAVATLGSAHVAAFGVASKIQSFAVVPLLALSSASPAFVGQNSAAGMCERSRKGLLICAFIALLWTMIAAALLFFLRDPLLSAFTDSTGVRNPASLYLAIVPISYVGYGITVALSAAMNGLGRSGSALALSGGRAIGLLAPLAWIGVLAGGFLGLAIATLAANLIAGLIGLAVILNDDFRTRDDQAAATIDTSECE